jgi:ribulose 1,5-bisphosphate synthetase/thiazole synthase
MRNGNPSRRAFLQGVGIGTVATVSSAGQSTPGAAPADNAVVATRPRSVRFARLRLPVLNTADVVIIGGSVAGVCAALEFARAGRSVIVVEHRNYLGRELAAPLKPWIDLGKLTGAQIPEPFAACLHKMGVEPEPGEMLLWMDGFKLTLEDLLLKAGVQLVYASLPTQVLVADGHIRGVVIGNKSGRQVLVGHMFLDCSSTAVMARIAGATFEPAQASDFHFSRVLEFTGVAPIDESSLKVPSELRISGDQLTLHHGRRGSGQVLIECPMELATGGMDLPGMMQREIEARRRSMGVAAHLIQNHPAFQKAKLSICAYELDGLQTTRLKGPAPAWTSAPATPALNFRDKNGHSLRLSLAAFGGPLNGLWCLNEAARTDGATRDSLRDPVNAALAGHALGTALLAHLGTGNLTLPQPADYIIPDTMPHGLVVKSSDSPQRGRFYERVAVPVSEVPVLRETDVLVVGGGTSGATCAAAAGREGAKAVVLELCPGLGGAGTLGGVSAYWYGRYWAGFCARNARLVDEVHKTINVPPHLNKLNGPWNIEAKMYALLEDSLAAGVEPFFNTITFAAVMQDNQVRGAVAATPYGPVAVLAKMTADTTGDGDVAVFAGAKYYYGAARDHYPMWYNLAQFVEPGKSRWHFMHTVDVSNVDDYTRAILVGRRRGPACHDHGCYIATRESRHIVGDVTLTLTDLLRHRQFPDVVNFGAGQMDCHRRVASDWIRIGLLLPILPTEMPYRALLPRGLDNILVAGKAFSGAHDALYSLRNQPELENLGGAVGVAAACAVRDGVTARNVNLQKVQKRLTEIGTLLPEMLTRQIDEQPYDAAGIRTLVDQLDGRHFSAWEDVQMAKEGESGFRQKIPIVEICSANPEIAVPILEQELDRASGDRQIRIAQALAMFGSPKAVPVLIAAIEASLANWQPPPPPKGESDASRAKGVRGGIPTAPADLVYSLAMTRDPGALGVWSKMAGMIQTEPEDFAAELPYPFHFTDSICYGAELLGDPAAIPILRKVRSLPKLNGQSIKKGIQINVEFEKRSLTEITLGRTLASLGSADGYEILIDYLDDNRANFAEFAHMTLQEFTGRDNGKDTRAWSQWLAWARESLKPIPLLERRDG